MTDNQFRELTLATFSVAAGAAVMALAFRLVILVLPVNADTPGAPNSPPQRSKFASEQCQDALERQGEQAASPEIRPLLAKQYVLQKLYREYRDKAAPLKVGIRDEQTIKYYNRRLAEKGVEWRVTPENQAELFGNAMIGIHINAATTGVRITGGGGNIFDKAKITGAGVGVELNNTTRNHFNDLAVSSPSEPVSPDTPWQAPPECRD